MERIAAGTDGMRNGKEFGSDCEERYEQVVKHTPRITILFGDIRLMLFRVVFLLGLLSSAFLAPLAPTQVVLQPCSNCTASVLDILLVKSKTLW